MRCECNTRERQKGKGLVGLLCLVALLVLPAHVKADDGLRMNKSSAPLQNPNAALSLEQLSATRERPLFTPSRKPPEIEPPPPVYVAAPPAEEPPPPPPRVLLAGVIVDENGPRAMLRTEATKIISVRIGDDVSGWKVTGIESRQITLSLDERSFVIALFQPGGPAEALQRHASQTAQDDRSFTVNNAGVTQARHAKHPH